MFLFGIVALHAFALYGLLQTRRVTVPPVAEVFFASISAPRQRAPARPTAPAPVPTLVPRVARPAITLPARPVVQAAVQESPPQTVIAAPITAEPAPTPAQVEGLASRARRLAGAADKEMRAEGKKQRPWETEPDFKGRQGKFEEAMAGAFIERGPPQEKQYQTNDGSVITRVGNTCYAKAKNSGVMHDPFRSSGNGMADKVIKVTCPS